MKGGTKMLLRAMFFSMSNKILNKKGFKIENYIIALSNDLYLLERGTVDDIFINDLVREEKNNLFEILDNIISGDFEKLAIEMTKKGVRILSSSEKKSRLSRNQSYTPIEFKTIEGRIKLIQKLLRNEIIIKRMRQHIESNKDMNKIKTGEINKLDILDIFSKEDQFFDSLIPCHSMAFQTPLNLIYARFKSKLINDLISKENKFDMVLSNRTEIKINETVDFFEFDGKDIGIKRITFLDNIEAQFKDNILNFNRPTNLKIKISPMDNKDKKRIYSGEKFSAYTILNMGFILFDFHKELSNPKNNIRHLKFVKYKSFELKKTNNVEKLAIIALYKNTTIQNNTTIKEKTYNIENQLDIKTDHNFDRIKKDENGFPITSYYIKTYGYGNNMDNIIKSINNFKNNINFEYSPLSFLKNADMSVVEEKFMLKKTIKNGHVIYCDRNGWFFHHVKLSDIKTDEPSKNVASEARFKKSFDTIKMNGVSLTKNNDSQGIKFYNKKNMDHWIDFDKCRAIAMQNIEWSKKLYGILEKISHSQKTMERYITYLEKFKKSNVQSEIENIESYMNEKDISSTDKILYIKYLRALKSLISGDKRTISNSLNVAYNNIFYHGGKFDQIFFSLFKFNNVLLTVINSITGLDRKDEVLHQKEIITITSNNDGKKNDELPIMQCFLGIFSKQLSKFEMELHYNHCKTIHDNLSQIKNTRNVNTYKNTAVSTIRKSMGLLDNIRNKIMNHFVDGDDQSMFSEYKPMEK